MAFKKVTAEDKAKYQESIKDYKERIEELEGKIKQLEREYKKTDGLTGYRRVIAANELLKMIALYCNMNDVSVNLLNIKNENYLNEGRKYLYKVLIALEEIVTPQIDIPLAELDEKTAQIEKLTPVRKLNLIRRIGYTITLITDGYGENTKWKWSFVEIDGRFATIIKNLVDWKAAGANNDPRKPFFVETNLLVKLAKEKLDWASKRYQEKYEISTREPGDIKKAIDFQNALRRINILFNESEESNNRKRTVELFQKKMEEDMKKKEVERAREKAETRADKKGKKK